MNNHVASEIFFFSGIRVPRTGNVNKQHISVETIRNKKPRVNNDYGMINCFAFTL